MGVYQNVTYLSYFRPPNPCDFYMCNLCLNLVSFFCIFLQIYQTIALALCARFFSFKFCVVVLLDAFSTPIFAQQVRVMTSVPHAMDCETVRHATIVHVDKLSVGILTFAPQFCFLFVKITHCRYHC